MYFLVIIIYLSWSLNVISNCVIRVVSRKLLPRGFKGKHFIR